METILVHQKTNNKVKFMGFSYSGIIDGLKEFYLSMRKLNVEIGVFEYTYNENISDVIFDTRSLDIWKLIFIKRGNGEILSVPVKKGYRFTIDGNEKYNMFINYFGIGRGRGQFSIKDFVINLNSQIPPKYKISDNKRQAILRHDKLDNDSNGIYPIGLKNWETAHAKNSLLPKEKYHRTSENLAKTKELYPEIYEATKDMDISISYGVKPGEKTQEIKKCKII